MNETLKNRDIFRSADLALCATIFLHRPLTGIVRENPRRAEFLFERFDDLDELIESYWRGEVRVDPRAYFTALREIKARLYDR